jgi:hypothetical protein
MCLAGILLAAPFASANTVWNPTEPNAVANGYAYWSVAANWSNGLPGLGTENPPLDPKAVFNVADRVECIIDSAVSCQTLSMGDGGTAINGNFLKVVDGGSLILVKNDWNAIGYNRSATLTVEAGGYVETGRHLMVGRDGANGTGAVGAYPSYLIIDGGTVVIKDSLQVGNNDADKVDGGGIVKVNSGLLDIRNNLEMRNLAVSRVDIRYGTIIINGNRTGNLTTWTTGANPVVTGFGGEGTVVFDYNVTNPGKTTVTAVSPMNPFPSYGETVVEGLVDLAWTNMDPNTTGDPVFVDVWFGTDPTWVVDEIDPNNSGYVDFHKIVVAGENVTGVQVNAPVVGTSPTTYYWQVDSYIYGADFIDEESMVKGDIFRFDVTDDLAPPVVIETPDMITWVDEPVQLNATISDSGDSQLFIEWTSTNPDVTFSPSNTVEDPVVTASSAVGQVTLTVTVWDALNSETNADTMVLRVAADACQAAIQAGANYPMDIVEPFCVININDLAALAADWLADYALTAPAVRPKTGWTKHTKTIYL